MTLVGGTHLAVAILALVSGAAVLLVRKGTSRHRWIGRVYVVSMLLMNGTALLIYRLFGGVGPFHVFAVFSLLTVAAGAAAGVMGGRHRRARRPVERARAIEHHYAWMTWSYVGLVAAAVSEVATRTPALRPGPGRGVVFGITVAIATVIVVALGAQLIRRRRVALLAPYGARTIDAPLVPSA